MKVMLKYNVDCQNYLLTLFKKKKEKENIFSDIKKKENK